MLSLVNLKLNDAVEKAYFLVCLLQTSQPYQVFCFTAELTPELFSDQVREMEELRRRIADAIESVIGLRISLKLAAPGSIPRSEGKAKRVTDERIR